MKKLKFPSDFDWGTASSGPQSEGAENKLHKSIWDYWYEKEKERFFQKTGPEITCDSYNRYREDIKIMSDLGLKSFRTSIQWTRLIKNLETGEPDLNAVKFYDNYIDELLKNGIEPVINLFHFDTPMELEQKYGGFKNKKTVELYIKYAKTAFQLFGNRVKRWITFNEPIAHTKGAYLYDFIYPAEFSAKSFAQSNYNILLAHVQACKVYKELKLDGEIGIILDLLPPIPRSLSEEDKYAARVADLFFNLIFMDPCIKGCYDNEYLEILKKHNCMFDIFPGEKELIKENTVDFVGINYYQPQRVKSPDYIPDINAPFTPNRYFEDYEMPDRRMNIYRGWEIYPKSIYDIAMRIKNEFGNIKWFISENGMGVQEEERFKDENGIIRDDYRIEFIKEHLEWLYKAIKEGSNCHGYHLWTFVDNWSWTNAYKNRYGLVSLDLKTRNRTIKKSGYWIKKMIKENGFYPLVKEFV